MIKRLGREELFVPIPDCPVHEPGINELFACVRACASAEMPLVFALVSGRVVTVVMKSVRSEATWRALRSWREHFPADASLFVCWNPVAGHRVLDTRRLELVWGEEWREAEGLWHGPVAFRQQIPGLDESALRAAEEFLAAGDTRAVVDLYCGLGHSLRRWGARGWPCVGVELSGESLAAAARNAPAAKLLRGRVEERLPQLDEFAGEWNVYTNPPRLGHDPRVLDWLIARAPERIAYLSCNPRTLARDLAALDGAYEVAEILPFDFFPQTAHVENLALLRRRGAR
jgi:23S rRNA (uracil1939-C5)-methyltransferase